MSVQPMNVVAFRDMLRHGCPGCSHRGGFIRPEGAELVVWSCKQCGMRPFVVTEGVHRARHYFPGISFEPLEHPYKDQPAGDGEFVFSQAGVFDALAGGNSQSLQCVVCAERPVCCFRLEFWASNVGAAGRIVSLFNAHGMTAHSMPKVADTHLAIYACHTHNPVFNCIRGFMGENGIITGAALEQAKTAMSRIVHMG